MEKYFLLTKNGTGWVATKWSNVSLMGLRNDLLDMLYNIVFLPKNYTIGKLDKEKHSHYIILTSSDVLAILNEESQINPGNINTYGLTDLNRGRLIKWNDSSTNVKIPEEYYGTPVTSLGVEAFKECTTLVSVYTPDCAVNNETCLPKL